jgi:hypothetical protein
VVTGLKHLHIGVLAVQYSLSPRISILDAYWLDDFDLVLIRAVSGAFM